MSAINPATDNIREFLAGVVGRIEASRFEQSALWVRWHKEYGRSWEENLCGYGFEVGRLGNSRPVFISLLTAVIGGRKILFWHATSQVVDYVMIEAWLESVLPGVPSTDATNAHIVING